MVNLQLGTATLDYWSLAPLELIALAKASRGELTEAEEAEQEKQNQQKLAAALRAALPPPPKKK